MSRTEGEGAGDTRVLGPGSWVLGRRIDIDLAISRIVRGVRRFSGWSVLSVLVRVRHARVRAPSRRGDTCERRLHSDHGHLEFRNRADPARDEPDDLA